MTQAIEGTPVRSALPLDRRAPIIGVYNYEEGTYARSEDRICVARWATTNGGHLSGELCGREATVQAGDVDLCRHHYDRVLRYRFYEEPIELARKRIRDLRKIDREYAEAVRESCVHRERIESASSLVYYIRRISDGMIKIGTTRSFRARMNTIRAEHGEIEILLTHSGDAKKEREMHARFGAYRIGRTEWFRPVKPLLRWILQARRDYTLGKSQQRGAVKQSEIRRLTVAAPKDPLWRGGKRAR